MYDDQPDEPIPPLDRPGVAAWWRIVALVSLLAAALLLSLVIVLFMTLAQQGRNVNNGWVAGPAPAVGAVAADADAGQDFLDPANPAYPTRQDLRPAGTFPLPGDPELNPDDPPPSPRQEFRRQVERIAWVSPGPDLPDRVLVSPDGANMTYAGGDDLMVGPVGTPDPVGQRAAPGGMAPGGRRVGGGVMVAPGQAPRPHNGNGIRATLSGWSPDGMVVAWVGENGRPSEYDMQTRTTINFDSKKADAILPLPVADGRLVVVTRESRPKLDGPGDHPHRDLSVVKVLRWPGDDRQPTVLVPPEASRWDSPALSPDGKRLAIISDHGDKPGRRRVFVLALEGDGPKVEPVSPPAERVEGVCWTPDGKELVYARSPSPAPADHAPGTTKGACDLFLLDLESRKETRLSRGGGFTSPSVTKDGVLFFLTRVQADDGTASVQLLEMPLKTAREWAEGQEKRERERTKGWADLTERVGNKAGLGADPDKVRVSADLIRKVDDLYRAEYTAVFKDEPPKDLAALERQRNEVAALDLAPQVRERLALIFGAAEVQSPGKPPLNCVWSTREGAPALKEVSAEGPFFFAFNPFRPLRREDSGKDSAGPRSLTEVLFRAEGRHLLFGNDPVAAKDQIDRLADADLASGTALLAQDKGDEADRVLLAMAERHAGNQYLMVHVGTLLYRHGRSKALARLLRPLLDQLDAGGLALARDPRLYNLLGVVLLDGDTNKAIAAFRDALRCDLNYGPAYLNLAQAYQKASRTADARLCLRRYLKLFPDGEWADDARRRLAVAGDE